MSPRNPFEVEALLKSRPLSGVGPTRYETLAEARRRSQDWAYLSGNDDSTDEDTSDES